MTLFTQASRCLLARAPGDLQHPGHFALPLAAALVFGGASGCASSLAVDGVAPPDQRQTVEPGNAPSRGAADAPVVLVEFGDFECPYCGAQAPVLAELLQAYEGRVRLVFKHYPLPFHSYAELAAEASLAAHAQGKFWPYHDALFGHPSALTRADLESYAWNLGLELPTFQAALDAGTYAAAVAADQAQGDALGLWGTPTVFVNGRMAVGAQPYEVLAHAVDEELATSTK